MIVIRWLFSILMLRFQPWRGQGFLTSSKGLSQDLEGLWMCRWLIGAGLGSLISLWYHWAATLSGMGVKFTGSFSTALVWWNVQYMYVCTIWSFCVIFNDLNTFVCGSVTAGNGSRCWAYFKSLVGLDSCLVALAVTLVSGWETKKRVRAVSKAYPHPLISCFFAS